MATSVTAVRLETALADFEGILATIVTMPSMRTRRESNRREYPEATGLP